MKYLKDLINLDPMFLIEAHGNGHNLYFASTRKNKIKITYALFMYAKKMELFPIKNRHINLVKS